MGSPRKSQEVLGSPKELVAPLEPHKELVAMQSQIDASRGMCSSCVVRPVSTVSASRCILHSCLDQIDAARGLFS